MRYCAVIDTETNWRNEVMSITDKRTHPRRCCCFEKKAMENIELLLVKYVVKRLFAYNASFDKNLLIGLSSYMWFDIMRIAAYKQYNDKFLSSAECWKQER